MATNSEIRAILKQVYEQNELGEQKAALELLGQARALALKHKSREFLSEVENSYANHYSHFSEFELELKHRRRSVALLGPKGHQLKLAIARSNLAGTLHMSGSYVEALRHLYRALDHYTCGLPEHTLAAKAKLDEASYLTHTLYTLANLHQNIRDFESAKHYLKLESEVRRKCGMPEDPDAYGLLMICHYETRDYASAERYAQLQLEEASRQSDRKAQAMAHSGLTLTALKQGNIERAREHNQLVFELSRETNDKSRLIEAHCNEAEIEAAVMNFERAKELIHSAVEETVSLHAPDLLERIYRIASEVHEGLQEYKEALEWYKLAIVTKEQFNSSAQHHEVARMQQARMKRALSHEKKLLTSRLKSNNDAPRVDIQHQLLQLAPMLSRMELKVCELLTLGASTKEMAEKLCASRHTIDGHRTAIRKKLGIPSAENLSTWLMRASTSGS
jgi:DNA-binding CsgD family transcriptional regulator